MMVRESRAAAGADAQDDHCILNIGT
jgi:hypothetical protein